MDLIFTIKCFIKNTILLTRLLNSHILVKTLGRKHAPRWIFHNRIRYHCYKMLNLFTPRYSLNIAEIGVKHKTINQDTM